MADIICPKCGKTNPSEAESCFFCGESLASAGEGVDWLSGLRSSDWQDNASEQPAGEEPLADAEIPDWLARVRSRNQDEQPEPDFFTSPSGETPDASGETANWLNNLGGTSEQSEGSADDWLSSLSSAQFEEEKPQAPIPPAKEPSSKSWFSRLQRDDPHASPMRSEPSEPPPMPAPEPPGPTEPKAESWMGDLQNWGANLDQEPPDQPETFEPDFSGYQAEQGDEAPAVRADLPDWFTEIKAPAEQTPAADDTEIASEAPESRPDWLSQAKPASLFADETPEQTAGSGEGENLPAWLTGFSTADESESAAAPAEGLPDWLRGAEEETAPAASVSDDQPPAALPDWMQATSAQEPDQPLLDESAEPGAEAPSFGWSGFPGIETPSEVPAANELLAGAHPPEPVETPDFAALFGQERETPSEAQPHPDFSALTDEAAQAAGETHAPEAEAPDLSALFATGAAGVAAFAAKAGEEQQTSEDLPDWLHPADEAQVDSQTTPAEPAVELPPGADMPDWLSKFDEARQADLEGIGELTFDDKDPFIDDQRPTWLQNIQTPEKETEASSVSPLIEPEATSPEDLKTPFQVELPEWLNQQPAGEAAQTGAPSVDETGEELAKADLPSWVEDLRPLEAVIPGEVKKDASESQIEKAGPLAGIRGVLQGEDISTSYRKPPVYSARLNVSERQRSQAAILENLMAMETSPKAVPSEPSRAPAMILRVVIALLLILSLLTMLLPNFRLVELPAAYPAGLTALHDRVEALPADAAVLLAVDYEPGFSGEMRYAASAVVEHLMVKNARMLFVSTVPTGPVLADQLLAQVNLRRSEYLLADRTVNLGYLPGGTTSLLEFAHNPKAAAPSALDTPLTGIPAWEHQAALGLNSLQDFSLVIVLTDSPETGRAWIEQVQPVLSQVPLAMVTSAQAAPLLQPYYDSGQIQGMTSGMQGGAMYEQRTGRVSTANQFLGAFQSGSLAGILLIIVGGIISAVLGVSGRKPAQKGKA